MFFLLSKLFNRFHWSTLVGMPGFLGALSIFAVPNQIAIMFSHSALVMVSSALCSYQPLKKNVNRKSIIFLMHVEGDSTFD